MGREKRKKLNGAKISSALEPYFFFLTSFYESCPMMTPTTISPQQSWGEKTTKKFDESDANGGISSFLSIQLCSKIFRTQW